MKSPIVAVCILALAFSTGTTFAQEPAKGQKRTPQLTSDDIIQKRNSSVISSGEPKHVDTGSADWTRLSPGDFGLSLELPGKHLVLEAPFPEEMKKHFRNLKAYLYADEDADWSAMVGYLSGEIAIDPFYLAAGLVAGIKKRPDISDLHYSLEPRTKSRVPIKGSFKLQGVPFQLEGFVIAKGSDYWYVVTQCPQADEKARLSVRRMLRSVKLDR
ncbi:MAG: hypothetical protein L0229_25040 [Blastocatellia bacterium]|nr:hypothetical protein [Blastocatellia bacterium]